MFVKSSPIFDFFCFVIFFLLISSLLYGIYLLFVYFYKKYKYFTPIKTDFILKIVPVRKYFSPHKNTPHYPPPGYGVPPDKQHKFTKDELSANYKMVLYPGGLSNWLFGMVNVLTLIAILPLVFVFTNDILYIALLMVGFTILSILISYLFYKGLYSKMGRPVLSDIWAIWPAPCNHMLRSVPYSVKLKKADKSPERLKQYPIYWSPKLQTSIQRQPRQYAPDIPTLQGVLLNFALFDLFFHKKPASNEYSNVLNTRTWATYWMSPVWISYLFLSIAMVVYFYVIKNYYGDPQMLQFGIHLSDSFPLDIATPLTATIKNQSFPDKSDFWLKGGSFVIAIILWMVTTALFIHQRLAKMIDMKDKVSSGYFKRYEELVPQQVLQRLSEIPEEQQIASIIEKQRIIFNFLLFGAFINYLMVLDAFK